MFDRRVFLRLSSAIIAVVIAGCSGDDLTSTGDDGQLPPEESETEDAADADDAPEDDEEEETQDDTTQTDDDEEEEIERPDNYRIDFYPEKTDKTIEIIEDNGALEHEDQIIVEYELRELLDDPQPIDESHPIYTSYDTDREEDEHPLDLPGLKAYHKNNWQELDQGNNGLSEFIEALEDPDSFQEPKYEPNSKSYPNAESMTDWGEWDREAFTQADNAGEMIEWIHTLQFNMERHLQDEGVIDQGPISYRDEIYAANIEKAVNEYSENFQAHIWSFKVDTGTHGNGLIHLKNTETGDTELRILETVNSYHTMEGDGKQYTPLIEDSNFFDPTAHERTGREQDPYELEHGLRFHTDRRMTGVTTNFETAKGRAVGLFGGIAAAPGAWWDSGRHNIAPTNELLESVTKDLREYNQRNDINFDKIVEAANIYFKHTQKEENNYIMAGTYKQPEVYKVDNQNIVDEVWNDENGDYNNFKEAYDRLD